MKRFYSRARVVLIVFAVVLLSANTQAAMVTVEALANSSSGGTGVSTISLSAGQPFTVVVDPDDLWNAGPLPRWSNADGLVGNRYATGSDQSGQPNGTLIGQNFGLWSQNGLSAPYGALVGQIGGNYFLIGTNYSGTAPGAGTLTLFYWDSNNFDNTESIKAGVNAVPIPAAAWLLGSGLVGLVALKRKYRP